MKLSLSKLSNVNWFFMLLVAFAFVLPLSQALVSIFGALLLIISLLEGSYHEKIARLKGRKILLLPSVIFILYLFSALIGVKGEKPFYDLQRIVLYVVFPFAFVLGRAISSKQKRMVLYVFTSSVFIATIITVINWSLFLEDGNFTIHKASLISHIRFSYQLILVFWFLILNLYHNYRYLANWKIMGIILLSAYFFLFVFFQQSLTGIFALWVSLGFVLFYQSIKTKKYKRMVYTIACCIGVVLPIIYSAFIITKFYDIEEVKLADLKTETSRGNIYQHYVDRKEVENGRYVYLHICEAELKSEWNKRAKIKIDENSKNGYPIYDTLLRYLTSKGLHKDAEGISLLNENDIRNIELGVANVVFLRKFSIYPRLYQTVWEYYNYTTTGYVNHQSFTQRIEFAKAAVTAIKKNKWFGVGTAHWREALREAFDENQSKLDKSLYTSSHNQYLSFFLKFGIIGGSIILFLIVYPIIHTKRYRDFLFLILLIFMSIAIIGDIDLEIHMGASFFLFFYCFFVSTDGVNYLQIKNN